MTPAEATPTADAVKAARRTLLPATGGPPPTNVESSADDETVLIRDLLDSLQEKDRILANLTPRPARCRPLTALPWGRWLAAVFPLTAQRPVA